MNRKHAFEALVLLEYTKFVNNKQMWFICFISFLRPKNTLPPNMRILWILSSFIHMTKTILQSFNNNGANFSFYR